MYGFVSCDSCGEDVNEQLDKTCRHCGAPVVEKQKEKVRDRSSRWAQAYQKICSQGHEYQMRLDRCPQCHPDYGSYLAQIAKYSGTSTGNSGWGYTGGKNWLAGRKI
jgi:ribosomal protein L37E